MRLDTGRQQSCWLSTSPVTDYPTLSDSLHADVLIIGAGIVGLSAALKLCELGKTVVVLEALRVGGQVTGGSTAKITTQHGLIYRHLIEHSGRERAQLYADANRAGVAQIHQWIRQFEILCDLEAKSAFTYTIGNRHRADLDKEAEAVRVLGFEAVVRDQAALPFETSGALEYPGQAQFNPCAYLVGLAQAVTGLGGRIFENSRARLVEEASRWRAATDGGTVHAEAMIVATNLPVKSPVGMSGRTQPHMHTAIAFRIDSATLIDGMFIGIDEPTHSLRIGRDAQGPLLIVLGPKFNTGQERDVAGRFRALEAWVRANFEVGDVAWSWCNEDYDTEDRIALAGEPDPAKAPGFHIATGFNAWGMSNGTAAGIMMAERIATGDSPWLALYDPARSSSKKFNRPGASQSKVKSIDDIAPGHGGVVSKDGEAIAVFKDESGATHHLLANCTHKGCVVTWNNAARTWDCPCHGSMFSPTGAVIHGPARKDLERR